MRRGITLKIFAFITSVLVHALLLIALPLAIDAATPDDRQSDQSSEATPPMLLPVEVRLGIDEPTPPSPNWLGDIEPEPHLAEQHIIEQAAFVEESAAAAAVELPPVEIVPAAPPTPEHALDHVEAMQPAAPSPPLATQAPDDPANDAQPPTRTLDDVPPRDITAVSESVKQLLDAIRKSIESAAPQPPAPPQPPEPAVSPAAAPSESAAQPEQASQSQTPREVGTPADKESSPTSIVDVPPDQWRLGKPLASHGLNLKPRRPHFELLTMLTAAPGNPLCLIAFGPDGVPVSAALLQSSGDRRVDEAILASLYRWRAEGAALNTLRPGETIEVHMRILLTRRKVE